MIDCNDKAKEYFAGAKMAYIFPCIIFIFSSLIVFTFWITEGAILFKLIGTVAIVIVATFYFKYFVNGTKEVSTVVNFIEWDSKYVYMYTYSSFLFPSTKICLPVEEVTNLKAVELKGKQIITIEVGNNKYLIALDFFDDDIIKTLSALATLPQQ